MSRFKFFVLLIALLTAACSADSGTTISELPTVYIIPSLTPSDTPTNTVTPTETLTPTPSPTVTASLTPTPTFTPTTRVLPTSTFTPVPPTTVATNTPTNTTVPATATATLDVTLSTAQIISFTASTNNAATGGQVTLSWSVVGDTVRIERLNQQGIVIETFNNLAQQGSQIFTMPTGQGAAVIYRLVARRGTDEKTATQQITLTGVTACTTNWFFGNQLAPPNAGCPSGAPVTAAGASQQFERGLMIYHTANGQNMIYALANPSGFLTQNAYIKQQSLWDNVSTYLNYNCAGTPVAPQIEPQQMFAWMFCSTFGPVGSWADTLGWASQPLVNSAVMNMQTDTNGAIYIDTPSGEVYKLDPIQAGNLYSGWTKIR